MAPKQLVMVHGAWHSPDHFAPLVDYLSLHDYKCIPVTLPSTQRNDNPVPATFDDDIAVIRTAILSALQHGDVAIIAHSFGGMTSMSSLQDLTPASRKAAGHSTAVTNAILIASFFAPLGGIAPEVIADRAPRIGIVENGFSSVGPGRAEDYFYNDLSEAEAGKWTKLLRPVGVEAFFGKTTYEGWKEVPISYLVCTKDQAFPEGAQRWIIEMAREQGAEVKVEEIEASHSPFLSQVERTGEFVRRSMGETV